METEKQELIKKLNSETLFDSRKMSGMWGNIQWSVEDIIERTLIVKISSSSINWNDESDKNRIARNIEESVRFYLGEVDVQASWKKWESKDGFGFLISPAGKTKEQIVKEVMQKVRRKGR